MDASSDKSILYIYPDWILKELETFYWRLSAATMATY